MTLNANIGNEYHNYVNFAWSMESGVWNPFPSLGFTNKDDINMHVWYSISSLVFNPNVGILGSQAWFSIPMLVLNHKFGIGSD